MVMKQLDSGKPGSSRNYQTNQKLQKEFTDKELFDLFQFRIKGL